jgi:hypothetical protein
MPVLLQRLGEPLIRNAALIVSALQQLGSD